MPICTPTVLILGAGASSMYGFPLGRGLRDAVCGFPRYPGQVKLLQDLGHSERDIDDFFYNLQHSGYTSVDVFLEHNAEFLSIGKHAIAAALLPCEAQANLFPPSAPAGHWYEYVINRMGPGTDSWTENDLAVITFNYDRSFEHYFTKVVAQRARLPNDKAYDQFCHVRVIHVYGSLGTYLGPAATQLRFGIAPITAADVHRAAQEIRVVSEARGAEVTGFGSDAYTKSAFEDAANALKRARRIFFLGFGFNVDNVRRLRFFDETEPSSERQVWGTAQGFNSYEWDDISKNVLKGHWRGGRGVGIDVFVKDWVRLD